MGFDLELIYKLAGKNTLLDFLGVFLAEYLAFILFAIFLAILIFQKDRRKRLYLIFFSTLSLVVSRGIIETIINKFFFQDRPFVVFQTIPLIEHATTASFPSGHAVVFFTIATLIFLLVSRKWGIWFFAFATLMGLARIYVGVHYPLDILVGALIGFVTPFLLRIFIPEIKKFTIHTKKGEDLNT